MVERSTPLPFMGQGLLYEIEVLPDTRILRRINRGRKPVSEAF